MSINDSVSTDTGAGTALVRVLLGSLGAGIITFCLVATAWSMPLGGDRHLDPGKMLEKISGKLDLDDSQRDSVEQILTRVEAEGESERERMMNLRNTIETAATDLDAAEIGSLANEIGALTASMLRRHLSARAEIYALLNDAQREELASLQQHRAKKRKHRRSHWLGS